MADGNATTVGSIVGKLKIDSSEWHRELSAAETKANQLGRANPKIKVETTGTAPASLVLVNGQDATGTIVVPVTLTAGQSTRDYLAGGGVLFDSGVFLRVVSGSVSGSVWVVPL